VVFRWFERRGIRRTRIERATRELAAFKRTKVARYSAGTGDDRQADIGQINQCESLVFDCRFDPWMAGKVVSTPLIGQKYMADRSRTI
jgi:hypothetical protein